ncbi:hypothetical protein TTHERM_00310280 (macronuclear) [Tetrahymena thermophila SB210]|uniref:Transmembrane protein n=1 Tax=Tetrahymena thermophila (strain SB210) TaxID=312017 RepID=I7M2N1_TETTS|nr:hypothetical protein TTHERM_00310280 [Tetrahymena thermophila SB210]EAS00858.1 hypothetical protein TTHERM_00310280 [Tetrahymena thermophila SB210]|eukprot:XP_001021103.1 hypothetical protein TTHERM_00310280 [Tetrahymena thermophila SB210]
MKKIFTSLLLSSYFLLQLVKSCDEIIQCQPNDSECLVQLRLFETCVSSRCDLYQIESQYTEELSKCYSETCSSKFEPFNQLLQKYSNCLIERMQNQSFHSNLPTLQTIIDPNLQQQCSQRLADKCVQLSPECPQKLLKQFECAKSNCFSPDNFVLVDYCFTKICQPDLAGLQILNKDYVQCLSGKSQDQTQPQQPSQPNIRSTSQMLILSLIMLILSTIMY